MVPMDLTGFHRLITSLLCTPGSPLSQMDWAMASRSSWARNVCSMWAGFVTQRV